MRWVTLLLLAPATAIATPVEVAWQGRLLDAAGAALAGSQSLRIQLWNDATGSNLATNRLYTEDFTVNAADGYVAVVLGTGGALDSSVFAGDVWVGVTVDPAGGGTEMSPRNKITHSPKASASASDGVLAFVPASLDVGTSTNAAASSAAVTLANLGDTPVTGLTIVAPAGFSHTGDDCGGTVAARATCAVTFELDASGAAGARTAVASAAGTGTNTTTVTLSGVYTPIGADAASAGMSCLDIKEQLPGATSQVYWIDPDGVGNGNPAFQAYCDMTTDGGGWTLVSRIRYNSRKHLHSTSYGDTPMPSGALPAKFSESVINTLTTGTAPGGGFSNAFRFACDNVPVQYFPATCVFSAAASVPSGPCHDYATTASSTTYIGGYGDGNDCGLGGHHVDPQKSSYGWHNCDVTDATVAGYPVSEAQTSSTGCGHNQLNSPGQSGTLWVR